MPTYEDYEAARAGDDDVAELLYHESGPGAKGSTKERHTPGAGTHDIEQQVHDANDASRDRAPRDVEFNHAHTMPPASSHTDELANDNTDCPMCSGEVNVLGTLGRTTHYRCRNCGWTFS